MATVKKELEVGKELSEVIDAVADLLEDILAKKEIGLIAAENLPSLMTAVDGYDQLAVELKGDKRNESAAYLVARLLEILAPDSKDEE